MFLFKNDGGSLEGLILLIKMTYPQIKIAAITPKENIVYIAPTAAVDSSKKLSDIVFNFCGKYNNSLA